MYAPPVNLNEIARVKQSVSIPVIGNGDIDSPIAAKNMLEQTGCDYLMVGRAAMGAPWIFKQINTYLQTGEIIPDPPLEQRLAILRQQAEYMLLYKDPRNAFLELRKHAAWYMRGLNGAAALRRTAAEINCMDDLDRLCHRVLELNPKI